MKISLTDLFPFTEETKKYLISFEGETLNGYPVLKSEPFRLTLTHHKNRVMEAKGDGELVIEMNCDRCLDPVPVTVAFSIDRKADASTSKDDEGEDVFFFEGDDLDADLLIEDEALTVLPMKVLCKEDCKGICHRCGLSLNNGKCKCQEETVQSTRMADAIMKAFAEAEKKK